MGREGTLLCLLRPPYAEERKFHHMSPFLSSPAPSSRRRRCRCILPPPLARLSNVFKSVSLMNVDPPPRRREMNECGQRRGRNDRRSRRSDKRCLNRTRSFCAGLNMSEDSELKQWEDVCLMHDQCIFIFHFVSWP